jgi:hypothetical protein
MYDAKEDEKEDKDTCEAIGNRGYFKNSENDNLFKAKSCHVPIENILQ